MSDPGRSVEALGPVVDHKVFSQDVFRYVVLLERIVIGLLKVIQTDNLIHKFNTYIVEILTNKSVKEKELLLVRKKTFDTSIDKFVDKFPDYWEPSSTWTKSLKDLVEYVEAMKIEIEKLEIHKIVDKNVTYEFYNSNNVRKLLKFNY